jgi:hypothetical protein
MKIIQLQDGMGRSSYMLKHSSLKVCFLDPVANSTELHYKSEILLPCNWLTGPRVVSNLEAFNHTGDSITKRLKLNFYIALIRA